MLARIETIAGAASARSDPGGHFLLVEPERDARPDALAAAVLAALGDGARLLDGGEAAAQRCACAAGEPWFSSRELLGLSLLEARILAERFGPEAARAVGLEQAGARGLVECLRQALAERFEQVHAEGGRTSGSWIYPEWPAICAAAADRAAGRLGRERAEAARAALVPLLVR